MPDKKMHIVDEWGGIDDGVYRIVSALNNLGFQTTGSCEGHIGRDSPAPWVAISVAEGRGKEYYEKLEMLLDEFYGGRGVADDIRLVLIKSNSGFWLHNGGEAYDTWRIYVEKCAARIAHGENAGPQILNSEEKRIRGERLPLRQKEIEEFASFLKQSK